MLFFDLHRGGVLFDWCGERRPLSWQYGGFTFLNRCESLSKTTKLLLLESLLKEVCISSGFDSSLAQEKSQAECLS